MSSTTLPPNTFMNNPLINSITGYIAHLQQQNMFSKERIRSLKEGFLFTIGFFVLIYCLIRIQILFFWLLRLIFRLIFNIISFTLWLPLKIVRFLTPKSIDYDILFPLFWLCSILSFYISKYFHEHVCQFYDQYLSQRWKIFNSDQIKREDIKKYLFIATFIALLLLQTLFILMPIALSIRHHHENVKVPSTPVIVTKTTTATTVKTTTSKSPVKEVVETMSENLYKRFIDAFTDENETVINEKHSPLVSDEKLEDTFKTIQKDIGKRINNLKISDKEIEKKSSRFQRWIVYYLKAPFQKYESKKNDIVHSDNEQNKLEQEEEEENTELNSFSSSSVPDIDDDDDDDDDDESSESDDDEDDDTDQEDNTTITEQTLDTIKSKISSSEDKDEDDDEPSESDDEDDDSDDDDDDDDDVDDTNQEEPTTVIEQTLDTIKSKISSSEDKDDDEDDDEPSDDGDDDVDDTNQEEHTTITQQTLDTIKSKISSSEDKDDDEDEDSSSKPSDIAENLREEIANELSSSIISDNEDSGGESDDEDDDDIVQSVTTANKIKEQLSTPIQKVKSFASAIANQFQNTFHSSSAEDDDDDNGESGYETDDEGEQLQQQQSSTLTDKIKETLVEPVDKVLTDVKNKLSSSTSNDDEEEEEEHSSILDHVKEDLIQPIETTAEHLHDKLSSLTDNDEDLSLIDRTKQSAGKFVASIEDQISSSVDDVNHKIADLVGSAEEFIKEKSEQIKEAIPKPDKVISKFKDQVVTPLEKKASKVKKNIKKKTEDLKTTVVNKIKSLKKPKTLTEKVKDKIETLTHTIQEHLPGHKTKPKTLTEKVKDKIETLTHNIQDKLPGRKAKKNKNKKSKLSIRNKLNGWVDDAWNIWHLTKTKLAHIFISSTKHARHLPRYNTTSLYTAYTDIKCYDYTKSLSRYRLSKRRYLYFLDKYRRHSPFPVYLSILKSNGPKSYRQYPNSSCAYISKIPARSFKTQLYRFVRFWIIIGLIIFVLAFIYKWLSVRKTSNTSSFYHHDKSDRSSNKKQQTIISNKNDLHPPITTTTTATATPTATTEKRPSINKNTISSNTQSLDEEIEKQLRLWLQHEQNDGFRNISETCRLAINNTFLKQLERLSVETLQFANAKIRNVSQNTNQNRSGEITNDKIVINAVLDIDHLILNIVNTFKEQHFSLEIQKLSGQLYILLVINTSQYSIEATLQQLQINPVNIIDPNHALSADEKQNVIKLIDETIKRTVVRCLFRLSDNQENINSTPLYNSSPLSHSETNKTSISPNQLSTSSVQSNVSRSHQPSPTRYQPTDSIPTVLINDTTQNLYTNEILTDKQPKRLLIRIVKAVKLHDVEQPYCILELNHPKQAQQTTIAKNGLNPFWDERFLFECDDKSNQVRLQIINRKTTNKRTGNNYVDTIYADVLIPFSYVTSTAYKQDVQISPQYPESIIRIESQQCLFRHLR
ncbi:unnamed protein product [Adineta steineri]|uniref:C2 domain-containing protein n=1 Tax=Adineta steineri TaxID=433720 RepID=A0A813PPS3_9BILA|nr:unnamed protein product [Adineta steineri]